MTSKIEMIIPARPRDLDGFSIRRILPHAHRRMVGPFIFLDHMGPAKFEADQGIDVRPHPHTGLATVTYLLEGAFLHRDSLGSEQLIEPGAVNWMTAGRGIVHSERTPPGPRTKANRLHGIQCWVALPNEHEETAPSFSHHPKTTLPEFALGDVRLKLLVGSAFGFQSPVPAHSDLFYLHVQMPASSTLELPVEEREAAIYVIQGGLQIEDQSIEAESLVILRPGEGHRLQARSETQLMLLGGRPVGPRFIWWNLVASSEEKLARGRTAWQAGPSHTSELFKPIPGDDHDFTPGPKT